MIDDVSASVILAAAVAAAVGLGLTYGLWRSLVDPDLLRTRELGRLAESLGWVFSADDVFDYAAMPFTLFEGRPGGRAANVIVGPSHQGRSVCAFDYRTPSAGETGPRSHTCVVTDLGSAWPRLLVQSADPEAQDPPLSGSLDPRLDVVELDPRYRTWTDDPVFARTFLDPALLAWLGRHWPDAQFEVAGALLLVWGPRSRPAGLPDVIRAADALCSRVPDAVWARYPTPGP
jgi:hypothetical protein